MADIFLSYARADRAIAEQVKAGLEAAGLSVFFDVDGLDGGDVFPDVLDREVKSAGAVVSLWSQHSLSRPWVKQECSIGLKRRCLVPLAIEALGELDVPVAFEGLQQIDFTGFHGDAASPEWQKLMRSLSRTLKRPGLVAAVETPKRAAPEGAAAGGGRKFPAMAVLAALGVLAIGAFAGVQFLSNPENRKAEAADSGATDLSEAEPETLDAAEATPQPAGVTFVAPSVPCGDLTARLYFDFDRTSLNPEAVSVLEEAMTATFDCDLVEVRIEAHDDLQNSPSYAEGVSQRRAQGVADWLAVNGVAAGQITSIGYGSTQPLSPGQRTPANRRADVFFDLELPERQALPGE